MNRAERRRRQKQAKKAQKNQKPGRPAAAPDLQAFFQKGVQAHQSGHFPEAEAIYRQILEIDPDHADANHYLGVIAYQASNNESAVHLISKALSLKPDHPEALSNLGNALQGLEKLDEAVASYHKALAIKPDCADTHSNLGVALRDLGRPDEAITSYRKALVINPDYAEAHYNLGTVFFMRGDLQGGWEENEWRWKIADPPSPLRAFPQPQWDGSSLEGKRIILWGEQGLGDEIRYASIIPDLLDKGAAVSIECTERLVDLFSRSFEEADVHAAPYGAAELGEREYDFQCPFPGLGRFLRPTIESFPQDGGAYLIADPERKGFWQKRLSELSDRPKVGILWRGQIMNQDHSKFYATMQELEPILTLPEVDFVNLMYAECEEERTEASELYGVDIHTWDDLDLKDDLDGVAALVSGLDLAICCLSTPGELAGALGVPTLTFLTEKSHFIMLGTGDTIWYPNTRYFSKEPQEPWGPVFEDMAPSVKQRLGL